MRLLCYNCNTQPMSKLEDENKTNSFCEYLASLSDEK